MMQALCMEEGNDIIICYEFEYPIYIRLVCYIFEYSTDLQWKWSCWTFLRNTDILAFPKEASDDEKEAWTKQF